MKFFTILQDDGTAGEIFPEFVSVEFLATESAAAVTRDVPMEERYTSQMIAQMVIYDPQNPPVAPERPAPTASQVLAERSARLTAATREIDPLQDLIDLGESTPEDEDKLTEWKTYRAAVSKVQTQAGYPGSVVWPQEPAL